MFLESISDDSLTDIHHGWFPPTMPDDVHPMTVVEVCVVKVDVVQFAPNLGLAFRPVQVHLNTST